MKTITIVPHGSCDFNVTIGDTEISGVNGISVADGEIKLTLSLFGSQFEKTTAID